MKADVTGKPSRSVILLFLLASACSSGSGGFGGAVSCGRSSPVAVAPSLSDLRVPIGQLPSLDMEAVLGHVKTLSSDEFEGRAPGTKGEALSVTYLADQ